MCGQEENEKQQEETVDAEETQNTSGSDEQPNIEEKLTRKKAGLNVKRHPIAKIRLCELCIETKEYRMITGFDARKKFPLRDEDWEELPYVYPERYSQYQRRRPRAYWEAEVRAFSQNYYLTTFGMTLEEYQLQQEAEELERKNVTLPARRLQRGIQAVELNGGMTEAVDYFDDQLKMNKINPHGHGYQFLTLMETMLTAPECPSHATIKHLMLYWSDLKALWGLLEKYQQYLTISIEKAKDRIAEKSGDVCPFQRTDGSYTDWTLYYNLHSKLQYWQEDAAHAIKLDALGLINQELAAKYQQFQTDDLPLYSANMSANSYLGTMTYKNSMPKDPQTLVEFGRQYDSLTKLWSWASKKLGYNIHASKWSAVFSHQKNQCIRAKIYRHIQNCAQSGKPDEYAPDHVPSGEQ